MGEEQQRFARPRIKLEEGSEEPEGQEEDLEDLGVFDLVTAFSRIRKEIYDVGQPSIIYDDIPVRVHMEKILDRLGVERAVSFGDLILSHGERRQMIGVFLALLELMKIRRIRARQPDEGGEILITIREDVPPDAPSGPA